MIGRNIRQIRKISQILLFSWSFEKTQLRDNKLVVHDKRHYVLKVTVFCSFMSSKWSYNVVNIQIHCLLQRCFGCANSLHAAAAQTK